VPGSGARPHWSDKFRSSVSAALVIALVIACSGDVLAQGDQTGFIPDPPITGQPVLYRETFPGCPPMPFENVDGESNWILVDGNEVHLFVVFLPSPCPVPPPGPTVDFSFGFLAAGEYTLFQYRVPTSVTFPVDPAEFTPVLKQSFTVVQGGPSPVPGLTHWGMVLLGILIAGLAIWRFTSARA